MATALPATNGKSDMKDKRGKGASKPDFYLLSHGSVRYGYLSLNEWEIE